MKNYVPIEKRSKKEQKAIARSRRATWGGISPVTRTPANPKAYSRTAAKKACRAAEIEE